MSRKTNFAQFCMQSSTKLSQEIDRAISAKNTYHDRTYGSGLVDDDVISLDIVSADISDYIAFVENLELFITNQTPVEGDYSVTLNKLRTDI